MMQARNRHRARIDIVPLIDVLTALIFFFMVTMNFRSHPIVTIDPPEIKSAGQTNTQDDIVIAINKEGEIFLNESLVSNSEFERAIEQSAEINSSQSVLVVADENSELKHLAYVFDCCRQHNLCKLRLQAR